MLLQTVTKNQNQQKALPSDVIVYTTGHTRGGSIYKKYRRYIADIDISVSYRNFRYRFFDISLSFR